MVTAATLHPAARRRLMATMPHAEAHDITLRPLDGAGPAGMIVTAGEQSFVEAVLEDLKRPDWRTALAARRGVRRGSDGVLELGQPTHRRFQMVLLEAYCRTPGHPRLNPTKIAGMALVLRREIGEAAGHGRLRLPGRSGAVNRIEQNGYEGWMHDGGVRRGWLTIVAEDLDPDPTVTNRRRPVSASRAIEALIAERRGTRRLVEEVKPLFLAPPDVCKALGRTVVYGLVPVASPEYAEASPPPPNYASLPEADDMRRHLSSYLKARVAQSMPRASERIDPAWRPLHAPATGESAEGRLYALGVFLQQLMVELGAFEPTAAAAELMRLLGSIRLPVEKDVRGHVVRDTSAADFVRKAAPILVGGEPNDTAVHMPLEWPAVGADQGGRLTEAALACLAARFSQLAPKTPKYHGDSRRYAVRGLIRVREDPACPARLIWSGYSEPFRIVPWWNSEGPVARIPLPRISQLKNLKPNVTFELPPEIANLLQGDAKKLKDGEGSTGGIDIFWLCSFSLPIITICAFIVLSIFLTLFDLIFRWMAWIKICIPIPRPK
jgi:hypothetical protein